MKTTIEKIKENERGTLYSIPVTLRQVLNHVPENCIEGSFGTDEEEKNLLLDDPTVLRVVFGSMYDPEKNMMDDKQYDIEVYQARLDGNGAKWESCVDWRSLPDKNYFSHQREVLELMKKIESLVAEVYPEYDSTIELIEKDFEDYIKEIAEMVVD